jgi:Protein of unknown function (DUF3618)
MGQTPDDIRYDVQRARARLGENLNELEYRVKSELDWRVHFGRHPWAFLGAAFGAAALIGIAVSGGSRRQAPGLR